MIKGTKAIVTEVGCHHFFIPGEIITATGEKGYAEGMFTFEGQARDYPYDQIVQDLDPEDYELV
jgi:hypothetical protein